MDIPTKVDAVDASQTTSQHMIDATSDHRAYWEAFYSSRAARRVPDDASPFARWVGEQWSPPGPLVDIGTGTGRDALWFARRGWTVVAYDYARAAVELVNQHAAEMEGSVRADVLDVYDPVGVRRIGRHIAGEVAPSVMYARFFVHAIEDEGRRNLWRLAATGLEAGGDLCLEFRVAETDHVFGEHYRNFVSAETVVEELDSVGATITRCDVGRGMAVHKSEDPRVARIVAHWDAAS